MTDQNQFSHNASAYRIQQELLAERRAGVEMRRTIENYRGTLVDAVLKARQKGIWPSLEHENEAYSLRRMLDFERDRNASHARTIANLRDELERMKKKLMGAGIEVGLPWDEKDQSFYEEGVPF